MILPALALLTMTWASSVMAQDAPPAELGRHERHAEDIQAIQGLLRAYTTAVTNHDERAFERLLLNDQVPFASTDQLVGAKADVGHVDTRRYSTFRDAVFAASAHYRQRFYNVCIEQDGSLAQASVDWVTRSVGSSKGSYGWKILQLIKVQGQCKIASELYTARSLPKP